MTRTITRYGSRKLYDTQDRRYVSLDDLALSPQCGFASTMEGNRLGAEDQRAKLRRVAETARLVWGG